MAVNRAHIAVSYNTVMLRDKKWIQKCRALVVVQIRTIAAQEEEWVRACLMNYLAEEGLKNANLRRNLREIRDQMLVLVLMAG